jgi:hypothetical protein
MDFHLQQRIELARPQKSFETWRLDQTQNRGLASVAMNY